jgi:hypothetical protein
MRNVFICEVKGKMSDSEVKVGLVNVNIDVREGLSSILTTIVERKCGKISIFLIGF